MASNIAGEIPGFQRKTKTKKTIFVILITPLGVEKNEYYLSWITQ